MSRLRRRREATGLSQAELAAAAGVSRPLVSAVEAGRHQPSVVAALRLAGALSASVEQLFDVSSAEEPGALPVVGAPPPDGALLRLARVADRRVFTPLAEGGAAGLGLAAADAEWRAGDARPFPGADTEGLVVAGCEPALPLIAELLPRHGRRRLVPAHATTGEAVAALADGRCHAACVHGRSRDLRAPRQQVLRLEVARWRAGLAFPRETPVSLASLHERDLVVAQRDPSASVQRALLRALRREGREPRVRGPHARGHLDAARHAALRVTDAALTMEPAARVFDLGFLPLEQHRVELWVAERWRAHAGVEALGNALRSGALRARLTAIGGYDLRRSGESGSRRS